MTAPRHLLLDFGGVCLRSPVELHRAVERTLGLPAGTFTWMGPVDPSTDPLWQRLLAREVSERAYWAERAAEVGRLVGRVDPPWSVREYMDVVFAAPEREIIRPEAYATVDAAHAAGRRVGVLTNDLTAFQSPEWVAEKDFFRRIDVMTDLSHAGFLKPDPRAYERALADLGVGAADVVFVDDQPGNVEGARRVGIDTVAFDVAHPEESWAEVRLLLGI